ncbi:MAG: hypothetical protein J0L59_11735, partial [Xanthomonadales bacterium]|nr:hypothetical protein [Xanthomonadales bacterium]
CPESGVQWHAAHGGDTQVDKYIDRGRCDASRTLLHPIVARIAKHDRRPMTFGAWIQELPR